MTLVGSYVSSMGSGPSFPIVSLPEERIVIVTGANSGLGFEIAKWTAMMGATVIMACRSEERTKEAMHKMNAEFLAEKSRGTQGLVSRDQLSLEYMYLDCASFKSVVDFVEAFTKTRRPLHVLFCNAGLGLGPYVKTGDNLEMLLQVNYLSQFLLTAKLLPIMHTSGPDIRILFMSSAAHKAANFNMETINYTGPPSSYGKMDYYGRSKLYQIMQMYSMAERLQGTNICVNSIHPGLVDTRFGRDTTGCYTCLMGLGKAVSRTQLTGAKCSIDCVVNPKLAGVTGVYFMDCKHTTPSSTARNKQKQEQLWRYSMDILSTYMTSDEIATMEGKKNVSSPPTNTTNTSPEGGAEAIPQSTTRT